LPGDTTTSQQQQQTSSTQPWAQAIPAVTGLLNNVSDLPTGTNSAQTNAIDLLKSNAINGANFGAPVAGATSSLLAGGNPAYTGILSDAYKTLQGNLSPVASGSMIGNNPALKSQLDTIQNDVTNNVRSQFAAAGRSGSPAESQAIARGVAQGEAPVIAGQYNQDVSNMLAANSALESGGLSTGTGLNSINTGNITTGAGLAQLYPGILNQNATSLLNAGNLEQSIPYQGTALQESQLLPIAGLGATSTGSSTGTTTQQQPLGPTLLGGILGGAALLGSGGLNILGPLGSSLMGGSAGFLPYGAEIPGAVGPTSVGGAPLVTSDVRMKHDIKHVGILNDGQNVYSFRFKGDRSNRKHIGLLAQEVELHHPEAVHDIGGTKFVDYDTATKDARAAA